MGILFGRSELSAALHLPCCFLVAKLDGFGRRALSQFNRCSVADAGENSSLLRSGRTESDVTDSELLNLLDEVSLPGRHHCEALVPRGPAAFAHMHWTGRQAIAWAPTMS